MANASCRMVIRHETRGGHVHMRVFVNGALAGNLCMRDDEFEQFQYFSGFKSLHGVDGETSISFKKE